MSGLVGQAGAKSGIIGETEIDYKTGTWAGDFRFGGASGTINGQGTGIYTKIGRQVEIHITIPVNNNTSGSGQGYITGLPFEHVSGYNSTGNLYTNDWVNAAHVVPVVLGGQTYIVFYILPQGTSSALGSWTNSHVHSSNSGKLMAVTATYTATS